ncbi:UDP-glucuronic acid decarboxylase family protein [Noviherbaspirillum soli]|uniref:UDP-glucuronic acid decarboxylase family protein n=1 Tax=Noviherbaspirillum soli TaxID=1064518 RepID=UPI00188A4DDD|nr:UDP-glucuronic acid decarboxylase family protein [Noviherbaspirillum soli]
MKAGGFHHEGTACKRILVTGGAGFLGSHLCEHLLNQGHDVLCVDDFYTGSKLNICHLLTRPNFELLRHDVTFPLYLEVDEICNLACPASPVHYQHDPVQTTKTSVHGATNMLGHVNPIGPRSCYDEGKRCAETMFMDYRRQHGMAVKIARIFNTYGPRMHPDDGRVVSNFIMQALANEPITMYGDGMQTRSSCFVDDLIDSLARLMQTPDDFCGPVNLGNPVEFTMLQLAQEVIRLTGSSSHIEHRPIPCEDPVRRKPDIALSRSYLGWAPKMPLEQGLQRTIAYFMDLRLAMGREQQASTVPGLAHH